MSAARAAMSASAATSALTGLCARGARRVPRRGASAVPRAVPSKDRSDVDAASKRKPPPSVIVGGLFVADAPQTDDDARAGSDRRVSTSAGRLPNGESESRSDVPDDHDETRRAKARVQTLETTALANEAIAMWLGAAILGPLLDHQHSRFDVLHYFHPVTIDLASGVARSVAEAARDADGVGGELVRFFFQRETGVLETAWWVPPLFGGAGVVIGLGHTLGDGLRLRAGALAETFEGVDKQTFLDACPGKPVTGWEPKPTAVALAVSFFATQYFFSGALATTIENPFGENMPRVAVDVLLAISGIAAWWGFDRTAQGFAMASLTAVAGPLAEIGLINVAHLYAYASPDFLGVPTWIPWVYFCGSPAVGLLSRAVRAELRTTLQLAKPTADVSPPKRKKAWRPPPRGFQAEGARAEGGREFLTPGAVNERGQRDARGLRDPRPRGKVTVVAEKKRFGGGADARDGPEAGSGGSGVSANDVSNIFSSDGAFFSDGSNAPRRSFAATNVRRASGSEPRQTIAPGESESREPLSRRARAEGDGKKTERKKTVLKRLGDAERVRLEPETRDARRARRAALRREVSALQRLKLRLEKVRDALVRKAKVNARANGEGEEDE